MDKVYQCAHAHSNLECDFIAEDISEMFGHFHCVHYHGSRMGINYVCDICNTRLNDEEDLLSHLFQKHLLVLPSIASILPNHNLVHTYCCDDFNCKLVTNDYDIFFNHLIDYHLNSEKGKLNVCNMCNDRHNTYEDLLTHLMNIHVQDYLNCPICNWYGNYSDFIEHIRNELELSIQT